MASRKEGIDPVVNALTRGIVTVGELAWAVKGKAAPSFTNLSNQIGLVGFIAQVRATH